MNPAHWAPFANHLWQSTLFAGVAGLLTLALRNNRARARHWVWLAASCKFLIPLAVLIALGSHIRWRPTLEATPSNLSVMMDEVSLPFTAPVGGTPLLASPLLAASSLPAVLWGIWACGFLGITCGWWLHWRRIRTAVCTGAVMHLGKPIHAVASPTLLEPGVFGVFRPALMLPEGIVDRLTPAQLEAVIAHELCHIRHRDNLIAAIHMFVEAVFWFHPLVWWIGKRMVEERERACDEEVLRLGNEPRVYAEGILNVCKLYVESPLVCVSGVTGANLKRRIETIMQNRDAYGLNFGRKLLLAVVGILAVAGPVVVGVLNTPTIRAQSAQVAPDSALSFEAASVKALKGGEGPLHFTVLPNRLDVKNMSLEFLIKQAYELRDDQISGPDWLSTHRYDIAATSGAAVPQATMRTMLQNLLVERFHLATHWEMRTKAMYRLVVSPNGPTMKTAKQGHAVPNSPMQSGNSIRFSGPMSMGQLAERLTPFAGKPVVDATKLDGYFTVALTFASEDYAGPADNGPLPPLLTTALQEQLGLKFVPESGPIKIFVVDHAEPVPTGN